MHIVKSRCKKNTPTLPGKTSTKAGKVHKTGKIAQKPEEKAGGGMQIK